jgi:hypothetical protein
MRVQMPPSDGRLETRFDGFCLPAEKGGAGDIADIEVKAAEAGAPLRVRVLYGNAADAARERMRRRMIAAGIDVV